MSALQALLEDLGRNIALVLALMFLFGLVRTLTPERAGRLRMVLSGSLFGLAAVTSTVAPVHVAPGVIMDICNVLVALAFVFEGSATGLIATSISALFRMALGGAEVVPGVLLILVAALLGELFIRRRPKLHIPTAKELLSLGGGISVAALLLSSLLTINMQPAHVLMLERRVVVAVLLGYPVATLLFGTLLSYEGRRRDAERALRRERDLLSQVAATSPASIVALRSDGKPWLTNERAKTVLGLGPETLGTRPFDSPEWEIRDYDGRPVPRSELPFYRVIATGESVWGTKHMITVNGRKVYLSINASPMLDDGELFGAVINVEDVTDRVLAERRTEESERQLRTLFNSTSEAIFVQPIDGESLHFIEVNEQACRWLGRTREELAHLSFEQVSTSPAPAELARLLEKVRERTVTFEAELCGPEQKPRVVEVLAHLVMLRDQPMVMMLARDLSERRVLEEQVRHSQKMEAVGRLAGGIAHDFNNLLGIIMSCSEAVERAPSSKIVPRLANEITRAAERGAALTRQLLTFGRRGVVVPRTVRIAEAASEMLKLLRRLLPANVEVKACFEDDGANVRIDPAQLEQVLLNLVVNARDSMPSGGIVELTTARVMSQGQSAQGHELPTGEYVALEVRDHGPGMSRDVMARVFEPFFTTKREGGTGLGLSICFSIVRQAGGHIEVESTLGQGSTFRVYLPTVPAEPVPSIAPASAPVRGRERIWLVEDEPSLRALVRSLLLECGYDVVDFGSGEEALARAREDSRIDLLLTDIVMPGLSGPELASELQRLKRDLKIVYMSGYASDALERYNLSAQEFQLVEKPFSANQLAQALRAALERPVERGSDLS